MNYDYISVIWICISAEIYCYAIVIFFAVTLLNNNLKISRLGRLPLNWQQQRAWPKNGSRHDKERQSLCKTKDTYTYWSLRLCWKALAEMYASLQNVTVLEGETRQTNKRQNRKCESLIMLIVNHSVYINQSVLAVLASSRPFPFFEYGSCKVLRWTI